MNRNLQLPLLLALTAMLSACGEKASAPVENSSEAAAGETVSSKLPASDAEFERIGVRFAAVEALSHLPIATVPATLAPPPNARVAVAAIVPGVVTKTLVVEGDSVRKGQALAVVAAREIITLSAGIEQASARVAAARANDRRLSQLAREGIIAGARADEARAALREAEAELNEQRRALRLVNGTPGSSNYTLTAPIAGKITTASIQTGSPVSEATSAYVIDAFSQYELTAQLPERLLDQVKPGMKVKISGDIEGEITSVASVLDPQTRSATMRARVPAGAGVVSGRALPVTILSSAPVGALAVPSIAVVEIDGKPSVFLRTGKSVEARAVETGNQADGRTVIRAGLNAGDQIAVEGVSELKSIAGSN